MSFFLWRESNPSVGDSQCILNPVYRTTDDQGQIYVFIMASALTTNLQQAIK